MSSRWRSSTVAFVVAVAVLIGGQLPRAVSAPMKRAPGHPFPSASGGGSPALSASGPSGVALPAEPPAGYRTVFSDDFNAPALGAAWHAYYGQPGGDKGGWWDPSHVTVG